MRNINVLILEDKVETARRWAGFLENLGYKVKKAFNGKNVEDIFANRSGFRPDIAIVDINLGEEGNERSGIEVAQMILQKKSIPIVFLTNYSKADKEIYEQAMSIGPVAYLEKSSSFIEEEFTKAIQEAFRKYLEKFQSLIPREFTDFNKDCICVKIRQEDGNRIHIIKYSDILYIETLSPNGTTIVTKNGNFDLSGTPFGTFAKQLEAKFHWIKENNPNFEDNFFKVYRSIIVNMSHIKAFDDGYIYFDQAAKRRIRISAEAYGKLLTEWFPPFVSRI